MGFFVCNQDNIGTGSKPVHVNFMRTREVPQYPQLSAAYIKKLHPDWIAAVIQQRQVISDRVRKNPDIPGIIQLIDNTNCFLSAQRV